MSEPEPHPGVFSVGSVLVPTSKERHSVSPDFHVFLSDLRDCPGSCPLQWTPIGVVDKRANENWPEELNRRPESKTGIAETAKKWLRAHKGGFQIFPYYLMNGAFSNCSQLGHMRFEGRKTCSQITLAARFKSRLLSSGSQKSSAVYIRNVFLHFACGSPDFMSLIIQSLLQVTSFQQVRSAALQILIPSNSADKVKVRVKYWGHSRCHYQGGSNCAARRYNSGLSEASQITQT